jgi:hypothetical protein
VHLGQNWPSQQNWPDRSWAGDPFSRNRGQHIHGAGRRRRRPESGELAARTGRGGGARGALECGGPDLRYMEVRGSLKTLIHVGAVRAEGRANEGPLQGLWRSSSGLWRRSSST